MKVIAINGSPRANGNTAMALKAMTDELERQGIETETIHVGKQSIHGCTFCMYCGDSEGNKCVFDDDCVNEVAQKNLEYLIKMHEENLPISQIVSELITAHESIKKLSEEYESLTRMSLDQYGYEHVKLPVR